MTLASALFSAHCGALLPGSYLFGSILPFIVSNALCLPSALLQHVGAGRQLPGPPALSRALSGSPISFPLTSGICTCCSPGKTESQLRVRGPRTVVDPENGFNLSLSHLLNADAGGPRLLTKLSRLLFISPCGLSGPQRKLTAQAISLCYPGPLWSLPKDSHSSSGLQ